ncbi:syntaxin-7 [Contarinia nasturtii]|uniref:syntaxin-7 n=1 Tax=Contarinia nasturtii TaxID=265458 RepID=UPI0012D3C9DD|nr:syntaxin-7 [Contarinia nasturtii]
MSSSSYSTSSKSSRSEAEFQKLSQTIATSIQKILQNVSTMQRMVNQIGTAQDSPDHKQQLHQLRTYTQKLLKDTEGMLNDLVNSNDDRHLKIQKDRLLDEFAAAVSAFQNVQKKTVDIAKSQYRQARSNNVAIPKPPGSQGSNSNKGSFFMDTFSSPQQGGQLQNQLQEDIDLQALEEQERTIRELEESIVGVNEIYKNLGALVFEQGNVIDSIESSVEQTSVFVSEGTEQLRKASHYRNQIRKKKFLIAMILIAIISVIAFIFWITN